MRRKLSTYGLQLREKQKAKRMYGVLERQFRRYFEIADGYHGVTGTVLLQILERRLDNIVCRLGFASSRALARQMVSHGHVLVNGKKVDIPSYLVREGEEISITEKTKKNPNVQASLEMMNSQRRLPWLEFSNETMSGKVVSVPTRDEIPVDIKEQLIVELYSK
jgi:small subunit ribosomal protein S4